MANQSTVFPIFLRAEYREDSNGLPRFISRIQQASQTSQAEIKKVGAALDGIFKARQSSGGALDLGAKGLRDLISAQQQAVAVAREVAAATVAAAKANGEFDKSLSRTAKAAIEAAKAEQTKLDTLTQQLPLLQRVQAELDKGTIALQAQLKAERDLANFRKTANINEGALRLSAGQASIDRAALSGATLQSVLGRTRASNPEVERQRAQQLAQEAAATRAAAAAQEELSRSAAKLLAQIDPLTAAQQRYDATIAEARRLLQEGAISAQQFANAQAFAAAQLKQVQNDLNGVTEAQRRLQAAEEAAAAAIRQRTAAVAELKAQINPAAAAQEQFNQKVAFAKAALDRGELSQREYARAVQLAAAELRAAGQAEVAAAAARNNLTAATKAGTTARGNVINSVRAERTAFTQLGQQLQDVGIQYQMGTSALTIFTQQLPQAAFALSGLADSTDRTKAAVGRFATFLSGPWGGAIVVATALLGPFIMQLFESGKAADESSKSQRTLTEVLQDQKASQEEVNAALDEYINLQKRSKQETLASLSVKAAEIATDLRQAAAIREKVSARIADLRAAQANLRQAGERGTFGFGAAADQLQPLLDANEASIAKLTQAAGAVRVEVANRISQVNSDSSEQIREGFALLRQEAERNIKDVGQLSARLTQLRRDEAAALAADGRSSGSDSPRARTRSGRSAEAADRQRAAAAAQLAEFGSRAAEQIQRINERFDEQPRLIDQASQAGRQLDDIIADLEKRKPLNFEQMISDARDAKAAIEDAVKRPVEDILRRSNERLAVERLIAQGRVDEAVALQEIQRLQEQIGDLTEEQKQDIRDQIALEGQKTRELRAQAELLELQADVARTVADSLRDVFSGRAGVGDFIKNFRQSLQDLQGARLFEDLFGPAFRQLEEELRGNTPQGRANARYTAEVNKTADTTARLETSFDSLADAATALNDRLMAAASPGFGGNLTGRSGAAIASGIFTPSGLGAFGAAALGARGIRVNGDRPVKVDVQRRSIKELAETMANATVTPLVAELEDLLGPKLAAQLGTVLSGVLAGLVRGGKPGAVLGGLQGLFGKDSDIGKVLGKALDGTETGTTVNGIGRALGIRGSRTGAQIGGALGAATGIPGLNIAGAVLGNIVGGLLKKTPRASATIGGVGGALGITGVTGTSRSLRDAANGLAGSVLSAVEDIARQLGATVDAARGRVSIGQRKDNLRVDPTGRGITRVDRGAIDFGDDTEAAIAFAVQDLINDGVITGLRASEQRLLQAGRDVQTALEDVLTFRSVFDRLQQFKDPVGFAVTQLNREFESLIELFTRAGASAEEFAQLEELYGLERARAIEEATQRTSDSLKQLLQDLKIGDSGLSLRARRSNAVTQFDALAARVAAGDSSAFDDFAEISQQLLDIERQLFGSTQSYFDRLAQITALTEQAIAGQGNVTGIGTTLPASPFEYRTEINRSIDQQTVEVTGLLRAINDNLIALNPAQRIETFSGSTGNGRSSVLPGAVQNF